MKKILLAILVLGLAGAGYFLLKNAEIVQNIGGGQKYVHENPNFSFSYEGDYKISSIADADDSSETILVSRSVLDTPNAFQMQIFIEPFDEDIALTADRIKRDIPDIKMKDEKEMEIGKTKGTAFTDLDQNTREIWFVHQGYLFQASSRLEDGRMMEEIMKGWKWGD